MTVETVKATYDRDTKKLYVTLSDSEIVQTTVLEQILVYADVDIDHEIVGVKVILS